MSNEQRLTQLTSVQLEARDLFVKKNKDYGNAFAEYGTIGVLVRIGDKLKRLISITKAGILFVESESLRDTLIDLHNYSAMAVMLIDEKDSPPPTLTENRPNMSRNTSEKPPPIRQN